MRCGLEQSLLQLSIERKRQVCLEVKSSLKWRPFHAFPASPAALIFYADIAFERAAQACWAKQQPDTKAFSFLGKSGNTPGEFEARSPGRTTHLKAKMIKARAWNCHGNTPKMSLSVFCSPSSLLAIPSYTPKFLNSAISRWCCWATKSSYKSLFPLGAGKLRSQLCKNQLTHNGITYPWQTSFSEEV